MSSADSDALSAEMRARRALGLTTDAPRPQQQQRSQQGRQRHRFVQDGEVPVTMLSGSGKSVPAGSRIADLEATLEAERAARAAAVRSLDEARMLIQSLQTRLAHTELVSAEAVTAERRAREEAQAALREAIESAKIATDTRIEEAAERPATPPALAPIKRPRVKKMVKMKPEGAPKSKLQEAAPVKWWLPGFNGKKRIG